MSWEKVKFSKLYEIPSRNGLTKPSKVRGTGYKMINMGELFANNRIYDIPMELVPLTDSEKKNCKVERNDLLFARQSLVLEGAGKCSIVMKSSSMTVFESHLIRIRLNRTKAHPMFYYYYFLSPCSPIKSIVSQCAQAGIRGSELGELYVELPPLATQRRIADILSAYDDLIDNNRKQIKMLEEAAQRLYKEWFVDLRFPGHEHTKIVDGVPEGWDRMPVGSLIGKIDRTKQIPTSEYLPNGKIPVIDQSREFIAGYTNDVQAIVKSKVPIIVFGDHTRILKLIQFPFAKGADGTQLIISASERMPQQLLYCSLMNIDLSNYHYARHFKYLKSEIILLPSKGIADDFEKITDPVFKKIQSCRDQCCWGQEARDRLLPKMMSEEVEV